MNDSDVRARALELAVELIRNGQYNARDWRDLADDMYAFMMAKEDAGDE